DLERSRKTVRGDSLPVPPSPVSSPSPNRPSAVSAQETERFLRRRLFTRLKQLRDCHRNAAGWRDTIGLLFLLPPLVGALGIPVGSAISREFDDWTGIAAGVVTGLGLATTAVWLCWWWGRKVQLRAQHQLAAKIDELLTEFPHECQAWGGASVLRDRELVEALLWEVDPVLAEQLWRTPGVFPSSIPRQLRPQHERPPGDRPQSE